MRSFSINAIIILTLSLLFISSFNFVLAQPGSVGGNAVGSGSVGGNPSSPGSLGGNPPKESKTARLENPLKQDNLIDFLQEILKIILIFATPIIVFFIILAGFDYVMARGNSSKVTSAHNALLYAIVGGVLVLGAFVILEVIKGTIDAFR